MVDSDYHGEVGVVLFDHGYQDFEVKMGYRIAQLVLEKIHTPKVEEMQGLEEIARKSGGFGSIGVRKENDTEVKKEMEVKNERSDEKDKKVKNETLKLRFSGGGQRTEKNRKSTEGTFRVS